jgi:transcriptional regulator with XRE-family HTH domain
MKIKQTGKLGLRFGEKLRTIRRMKGLTQAQLADLANTSQRMIAHYESHIKRPPLDKINDFAVALNIPVEELLENPELTKEQRKKEEVSYSIMKRVKIIEQLPTRDQKAIFRLINSLAEKNKLKGNL